MNVLLLLKLVVEWFINFFFTRKWLHLTSDTVHHLEYFRVSPPFLKETLMFSCLTFYDFPGSSAGKESACQCRRPRSMGSIPGLGRSSGGEHGNPLQYSCLGNSMDRGAWRATVHGVAKSRTCLSNRAHISISNCLASSQLWKSELTWNKAHRSGTWKLKCRWWLDPCICSLVFRFNIYPQWCWLCIYTSYISSGATAWLPARIPDKTGMELKNKMGTMARFSLWHWNFSSTADTHFNFVFLSWYRCLRLYSEIVTPERY